MSRLLTALLIAALVPAAAGAQELAPPSPQPARESTWKGAFEDSLRLLLVEHAIRVSFQDKTRRELGGPFFADYQRSIRFPRKWEDGDSWLVNYLGHPVHGAAAARIWLDHSARGREYAKLSKTQYWTSRAIATAWAAGYSLQFEFGPLSEASIGNVGRDPETTGWVDHVVTPAGALAITAAEDAIDKFFIELIERHTRNRFYRITLRVLFNPARTMANLSQFRAPWHRFDRTLR